MLGCHDSNIRTVIRLVNRFSYNFMQATKKPAQWRASAVAGVNPGDSNSTENLARRKDIAHVVNLIYVRPINGPSLVG